MRSLLHTVLIVWAVTSVSLAKVFEKCELATILENEHNVARSDIQNLVCIAGRGDSRFNSEAVDSTAIEAVGEQYGLFKISSKYWCGEENFCKMPCSALLDGDLTDDLACIDTIISQTERWKGRGTGMTAWGTYVTKCMGKGLKGYMSECWSPSPGAETKAEQPQQPGETTGNEVPTSNVGEETISNLPTLTVPIVYQTFPYAQPVANPYGFIFTRTYQ